MLKAPRFISLFKTKIGSGLAIHVSLSVEPALCYPSTTEYRKIPPPVLGLLVVLNFLVFSLMTHNPGRASGTATDAEGRDHSVPSTWSSETRLFLPSLGGHPDLRLVSDYKPLSLHGSPGSAIRMSTTICQTINGKEY